MFSWKSQDSKGGVTVGASYGWESIMIEVFEALVPVLRDGSTLDLSADNAYAGYAITSRKLVQKNRSTHSLCWSTQCKQ